VDAFSCNEQFSPLLEAVWVTENHLSQGSSTAGVVNNVLEEKVVLFLCNIPSLDDMSDLFTISTFNPQFYLHNPLDVAMAFSKVNMTEFSSTFSVLDMGFEDGARTFSLSPDHTSHCGLYKRAITLNLTFQCNIYVVRVILHNI